MTTDSEKAFQEWEDSNPNRMSMDGVEVSYAPTPKQAWQAGQAYGEQQAIERVLGLIDDFLDEWSGHTSIFGPENKMRADVFDLRNAIQSDTNEG